MLLIAAVIAGLVVGLVRSWIGNQRYEIPQIRHIWLVFVAFLPQWLAFYLPATRRAISDQWASIALISSQFILLIFVWINNLHQPFRNRFGLGLLAIGLILNLTVILLNGGLMPISPEKVSRLVPDAPAGSWEVGSRLGTGKDIVLPLSETRLRWLSDYFYQELPGPDIAFSLGDVIIAIGAFMVLCAWDNTQSTIISISGSTNTP
jgi:hypothetical protein